jgi:hypothetical protein
MPNLGEAPRAAPPHAEVEPIAADVIDDDRFLGVLGRWRSGSTLIAVPLRACGDRPRDDHLHDRPIRIEVDLAEPASPDARTSAPSTSSKCSGKPVASSTPHRNSSMKSPKCILLTSRPPAGGVDHRRRPPVPPSLR